jgi:hypothetical protein
VPDTAPDIYADYIKSLVDAEVVRKTSLEQRGAGVVTTSGTLVTLLFALIGVITAAKNFSLPTPAHGYLGAAVILFAIAVGVGLTANLPFFYKEAEPTAGQLSNVWGYNPEGAQAVVISTRLTLLSSYRHANAVKGWLVLTGGIVQLAAVVMLVLAVLSIIGKNPSPVNQ